MYPTYNKYVVQYIDMYSHIIVQHIIWLCNIGPINIVHKETIYMWSLLLIKYHVILKEILFI
jgi:hypothetical protein